jgi:hypothetical protein
LHDPGALPLPIGERVGVRGFEHQRKLDHRVKPGGDEFGNDFAA